MHRTTLSELMSCTSDGKRLVAHAADTGEPVHIYNALSGLACNCICPGCERRMVAHRGSRRQHFQHEARIEGRTCISSGETALHKFAKTVLGRELVLVLSALDETDGFHTVHVVREGRFEFEKANPFVVLSAKCYRDIKGWHFRPWIKDFVDHLDDHWSDKSVRAASMMRFMTRPILPSDVW
ncbi:MULTISPECIES: hypothetical protein [unclassified Mesorhizobium]|uniref:hypothetical protein n=1 Tax=unclassified Mesorhizobium TaxID=325217 RepID=UPI0011285C43|nr:MULTISPECIES: hypothetical protein [unclassified Mesorhizobium]MBZ9699541.1 hypothetical protein [Mesorhizobium sp. CO1-1-3]MBZ9945794.1 hypothetical protein [Mesorhizobium sp. BR1-1-11]TPJ08223.1 hypothetical protein FJ428_07935 [Mesorhizobium sp. B2-8-1]